MPSNFPGRLGPSTAAFILVVAAVGAVTRVFGVDAGLLALVLAVVAIVLGPHVYGGVGGRVDPPSDRDPGDSPSGNSAARPGDPEDGADRDRSDG